MKIRKFGMMGAVLIAVLMIASASVAQPCSPPTGIIHVGESLCLQVCAFENYAYTLEGGGRPGIENYPILTMAAGCNQLTTNCDVQCVALDPPDTLVLGGDGFDPESYYGTNECFDIHLYWVHDDVWTIEVFSFCDGCFCITYDRQLPVQLMEFTAHSSVNSVELRWATASEENTDRYEIERDGQLADNVDATGSSSTETHYSWLDRGLVAGVDHEYRLIEVTMDGSRTELGRLRAAAASNGVASSFALYQNFPNPFNPTTSISFDLAENSYVSLKVLNLVGQEVRTLVSQEMRSGKYTVGFNAAGLASGVYLYRIETGSFTDTRKMVILK